jgi:hypothetical protein
MADTRLKAVAPADHRRRTVFSGVREPATANAVSVPVGHSDAGICAGIASSSTHSVFAHTFPPLRPICVRAGTGMRSGVPRLRQSSRTGLPLRSQAQAFETLGPQKLRSEVAHALWMVSMGADHDSSVLVAH